MQQLELKTLIEKLSPEVKRALEGAAALCVNRQHHFIEVEHWLSQLLQDDGAEIRAVVDGQNLNRAAMQEDLERRLGKLKGGHDSAPALAAATLSLIQDAWLVASVNFQQQMITAVHMVLALIQKDTFTMIQSPLTEELQKLSLEKLKDQARGISAEAGEAGAPAAAAPAGEGGALQKYTQNLTEAAENGEIDAISGRNSEIRQVIDILSRRRQNNPILVGEPGVGKTAVVEGLAQRIAEDNVPDNLKGVQIHVLDLGLLQAGASIKGEFENRLKDVINEVKSAVRPTLVFIDEAHTLIGAGGAAGQNDAANLLKPALARGEFRTIAATTWAEYKQYFEKDAALTRRFQVVSVEEPGEEDAIQMVRGVARSLENHHGVRVEESGIRAAVSLSIRYLPSRQLPDKAISLLDTACSRVGLSQTTVPETLESLAQSIRYLESEIAAMEREEAVLGLEDAELLTERRAHKAELEQQQASTEARWQEEKALAEKLRELDARLDDQYAATLDDDSLEADPALKAEAEALRAQLHELQGESPLVLPQVNEASIAAIIESWTGIPAGNMLADEVEKLLHLEAKIGERVIGQRAGIDEICKSIRISRAGLTDPRKPIGVFLMCGPSGVGKTETAMALADQLYGGEKDLIVINMTEFKEEHKVSALLGAPAGYVGYGEGGILTEAVRRNPYSILLLDEMEKSHPSVHDIFYQIFDKGHIKDSEGRDIDFRNTIIIMTSNAADFQICDVVEKHVDASGQRPERETILEEINDELMRHFKPAFLGRATVVPYLPLDDTELTQISALALRRIERNVEARYGASFSVSDDVIAQLVSWNDSPHTGGRAIEQLINQHLMPQLATACITRMSEGLPIERIEVTLLDQQLQFDIS